MKIDVSTCCAMIGACIIGACITNTQLKSTPRTKPTCACCEEVKSLRDDVNQLTLILSELDDAPQNEAN